MTLTGAGKLLRGTYGTPAAPGNQISGTQEGRRFTFSYEEPGVSGEGTFDLAEDGLHFDGKWRPRGVQGWAGWSGKRVQTPELNFNGVWKTDFGLMRLVQTGEKVEGCYAFGGRSTITGTAAGDLLQLTYTEPQGVTGKAEFRLSADRANFAGTWTATGANGSQPWQGSRVEPQAGREWLIVFEARWESSLQEPEFSYGEMLRQFFTRVPTVNVRHRTFIGAADFAHWAADLPYFTEPVVLYVSSHGDRGGIRAGGEALDGKFLGEQLRYAPAVKLIHLGACLAMSGAVPEEIRQAAGAQPPPVSGFTNTADWAGSAVIDFAYLDLILARKLPPGKAAEVIRKNIAFARETATPDGVIAPAGLKVVE
jgi:hypothetical protein